MAQLWHRRDLANYIGAITITRSWTGDEANEGNGTMSIDDLGWVVISEPTAAALLGLGFVLVRRPRAPLRTGHAA